MKVSRVHGWALALPWACILALTSMANLHGAPNAISLTSLEGRYRGSSKVLTVAKSLFVGSSKMRFTTTGLTAGRLRITAKVKVDGHAVPVNNVLIFDATGSFRGRELAPGATHKTPFLGTFTAQLNQIDFQGPFKLGKVKGTFSGTLKRGHQGKLSVTYSVFVQDVPTAAYVYTYRGR